MKRLTLIRGIPGSGKTTLAWKLISSGAIPAFHVEADMYHEDRDGNYVWKWENVHKAHEWCQEQTEFWLDNEYHVFVSNTFTTLKELVPYFTIAKKHNIIPSVIVCQNEYGNVHNVPEETLIKMKKRFQYDASSLFEGLK